MPVLVNFIRSRFEAGAVMPHVDLKSKVSYVDTHAWVTSQDKKALGEEGEREVANSLLLGESDRQVAAAKLAKKQKETWLATTRTSVLRVRVLVAWVIAVNDREVDKLAPVIVMNAVCVFNELCNRNSAQVGTEFMNYWSAKAEKDTRGMTPMQATDYLLYPPQDAISTFKEKLETEKKANDGASKSEAVQAGANTAASKIAAAEKKAREKEQENAELKRKLQAANNNKGPGKNPRGRGDRERSRDDSRRRQDRRDGKGQRRK
jgi:hypothetical protein